MVIFATRKKQTNKQKQKTKTKMRDRQTYLAGPFAHKTVFFSFFFFFCGLKDMFLHVDCDGIIFTKYVAQFLS